MVKEVALSGIVFFSLVMKQQQNISAEARKLWFTEFFKHKHHGVCQLLQSAILWPGSHWRLAPAAESADVVLGTQAEQAAGRRMKTSRRFLQEIAVVDQDLSGGTA